MKWLGVSLFLGLIPLVSLDLPLLAVGAPERPWLLDASSTVAGSAPSSHFLPLDEITIDDLIHYFADGTLTSVDLVRAYIERIFEVNHVLHAVGEINPDALSIARILDAERVQGHIRGPLHGVPILVKDNIATLDKLNNTAGSFALVGATVTREATVITKLRSAGAIILGKATMGEWAQCRSRKASSSHGWSAYGGQVYGAYYPQQDPSGSSSGSAVAVSVGLALASIGTETSGSIVNPSEKGNGVGIKPTLGLTSRSMVIPISLRQDTVGPMTRTVKDAAYVLSAIAGPDKFDNWTSAQPFRHGSTPDYVKACDFFGLKGVRIGIPRNGIDYFLDERTKPIMDDFENALQVMSNAGATIIDKANFPVFDFPAFSRNASIVLDTDFVAGLAEYFLHLDHNPFGIHSLEDLAAFTKGDPREEYPDRDTYVWDRELSRNISSGSSESFRAYEANLKMGLEEGVVGALDRYGCDVLVLPTFASFHLPAIAGLPIVTVPLGYYPADTPLVMNLKGTTVSVAPNIPFGISFVGRAWSEEKLISVAYAFEQRTMVRQRVKPLVSPKFELQNVAHVQGIRLESTLGNTTSRQGSQKTILHRARSQMMDRVLSLRSWTLSLLETIDIVTRSTW
ncbi:hypothetical protein MMC26_000854 [Xylographa opegraphella]|nr:hypothetical protein [Xylographa opegraphella]